MNLSELQSVQSKERQADSLQNLRSTFYEEAGEFIEELREKRDRAAEQADDPFASDEVRHLTDDIETAEQTVEAIYERRVGKVVKMASIAAADMPTEEEGLTAEERRLFDTLVEAIEQNRERVMAVVDGDDPDDVDEEEPTTEAPDPSEAIEDATPDAVEGAESGVDAADLMGGGGETDDSRADPDPADLEPAESGREVPPEEPPSETPPEAPPDESAQAPPADDTPAPEEPEGESDDADREPDGGSVDRATVQITSDVGEIYGVDEREYDLSAEDVVTLPERNADPLVERDAAERLD